jgi:class 3 adenylate cyclase
VQKFVADLDAGPDRVLATVLFTDIVASSEHAARLGDRGWRDLLEQHHEPVRRELPRYRGVEVDMAGDGFFASFDGPGARDPLRLRDRRGDVEVGHCSPCRPAHGQCGRTCSWRIIRVGAVRRRRA